MIISNQRLNFSYNSTIYEKKFKINKIANILNTRNKLINYFLKYKNFINLILIMKQNIKTKYILFNMNFQIIMQLLNIQFSSRLFIIYNLAFKLHFQFEVFLQLNWIETERTDKI